MKIYSIMVVRSKKIVILILLTLSVYMYSCRKNNPIQCLSFKEIQNYYYQEFEKNNVCSFDPFYIDDDFYNDIEQQLNQMIRNSSYCSIYIRSSINNAICDVCVIFSYDDEIYFCKWNKNGIQTKDMIRDSNIEKILKKVPRQSVMVDKPDLIIMDGVTEYVIKKIGNKTFLYANHGGSVDDDYQLTLELFKNFL